MAVLEVLKAGNPVLKEKSLPVAEIDKKMRRLLDDMTDTMKKYDGVGLAAPQVGKLIRVVVIDVGKGGRYELINPVIVKTEGKAVDSEGCLSVPDIFGEVERAEKVTVEYTNRWNKQQTLNADGLLARCIQHEIDHLEGRLFIDIAQSIRKGEPK